MFIICTLNFTIGEDYNYGSGSYMVVFDDSTTIFYLSIPIINDNIVEDDENFTLTIDELSLPSDINIGDETTVAITIANDDCKLIIRIKQNYSFLSI